jgi:hypothetical protein
MPIGEGRFLHKHTIWRKEIGGNMERIKDALRQCHIQFADGKFPPVNTEDFEVWYRRLPIHKMFLQGKESEIHYITPDNDCELSEKEDHDEDDETRISSNVNWDRDVSDHVDY